MFVAVFLLACGNDGRELDRLAARDDLSPSEILHALDTLRHTFPRSSEERRNYRYLRAKARYRMREMHVRDTLLQKDAAWFLKKGKADRACNLYLYAGCAYREADIFEQAFLCFEEAEEIARSTGDELQLFRVLYEKGSLSARTGNRKEALEHFRGMMALGRANPVLQAEMEVGRYTLNAAKALLYLGEYEESVRYYGKLTDYLVETGDSARIAAMFYEIAFALERTGHFGEAKSYVSGALSYSCGQAKTVRPLLLLADIFRKEGQADSLAVALERAGRIVKDGEAADRERYYFLLSALYEMRGDTGKALQYFKQYDAVTDTTYELRKKASLSWYKERYEKRKTEKRAKALQVRNTVYALSVALLLCMVFFLLYVFRQHVRKKEMERISSEDLINRLHLLLAASRNRLQEAAAHNLNIAKGVASLQHAIALKGKTWEERVEEAFRDEEHPENGYWADIYSAVNLLFDDFEQRLRNSCPELSEKDVQLCCLLRAGFGTADIACMTGQSISSVQKRKTILRKRLGMSEGADIVDFLSARIATCSD